MLTADLIHVRRRGDHLYVVALTEPERPHARELAATALALVRSHVGLARGALLEAWQKVAIASSENRLARALFKLALDACEFDRGAAVDPVALRHEIFTRAASARRSSSGDFSRALVLQEIARSRGVDAEAVEEALYADLPTAHVLRKADLPSPDGLLSRYEMAQRQAVLLRAVRVRARVCSARAAGYRTLFRELKFHRLLYTIEKTRTRCRLHPSTSMARSACSSRRRSTDSSSPWPYPPSWPAIPGMSRQHCAGARTAVLCATISAARHVRARGRLLPGLPDEVAALQSEVLAVAIALATLRPADTILDLPGIGVCVPDLDFVHRESGLRVFLEVLGFWSRAAVWKRVELVQAGLPHPIVFAVGKHLRVSEDVLGDESPAALYVYARTMNARAVLARIEAVAGRRAG